MMTDRCEHIHDFTIAGGCMAYAVGCEDGKVQCPRNSDRCLVAVFLSAVAVTLQFDINIARTEQVYESLDFAQTFVESATRKGGRQRAFVASRETDHPFGVLMDICQHCSAFGLRVFAQLVARD
jgi:hypothetical protein